MSVEAQLDAEDSEKLAHDVTTLPLFIPARFRDEWLKELSGSELLVFLAYVSRANKEGLAWPSIECLCRDTGLSKNTVKAAKKSLVRRGLLGKVRQEMGKLGMFGKAIVRVRQRF
jgi:hypothetical protein